MCHFLWEPDKEVGPGKHGKRSWTWKRMNDLHIKPSNAMDRG